MPSPITVTGGATNALRNLLNSLFLRKVGTQILTDAATVAFDVSLGSNAQVTLNASRIIGNPTNARAGDSGHLVIVQPGGGNAVATWGSAWKHAGGTDRILSTTGGARDVLEWYTPDGTNFEILTATAAPEEGGPIVVADAFARYSLTDLEIGDIVHQTDTDTDYEWDGPDETVVGLRVGNSGNNSSRSLHQDIGTLNGKRNYQTWGYGLPEEPTISGVFWTGTEWHLTDNQSAVLYRSTDDVAFPWLVTTWINGPGGGSNPQPILYPVTQGEIDAGVRVAGAANAGAPTNGIYTPRGIVYGHPKYNKFGAPDDDYLQAIGHGGSSMTIWHELVFEEGGLVMYESDYGAFPWLANWTTSYATGAVPSVDRHDAVVEANWTALP